MVSVHFSQANFDNYEEKKKIILLNLVSFYMIRVYYMVTKRREPPKTFPHAYIQLRSHPHPHTCAYILTLFSLSSGRPLRQGSGRNMDEVAGDQSKQGLDITSATTASSLLLLSARLPHHSCLSCASSPRSSVLLFLLYIVYVRLYVLRRTLFARYYILYVDALSLSLFPFISTILCVNRYFSSRHTYAPPQ